MGVYLRDLQSRINPNRISDLSKVRLFEAHFDKPLKKNDSPKSLCLPIDQSKDIYWVNAVWPSDENSTFVRLNKSNVKQVSTDKSVSPLGHQSPSRPQSPLDESREMGHSCVEASSQQKRTSADSVR